MIHKSIIKLFLGDFLNPNRRTTNASQTYKGFPLDLPITSLQPLCRKYLHNFRLWIQNVLKIVPPISMAQVIEYSDWHRRKPK